MRKQPTSTRDAIREFNRAIREQEQQHEQHRRHRIQHSNRLLSSSSSSASSDKTNTSRSTTTPTTTPTTKVRRPTLRRIRQTTQKVLPPMRSILRRRIRSPGAEEEPHQHRHHLGMEGRDDTEAAQSVQRNENRPRQRPQSRYPPNLPRPPKRRSARTPVVAQQQVSTANRHHVHSNRTYHHHRAQKKETEEVRPCRPIEEEENEIEPPPPPSLILHLGKYSSVIRCITDISTIGDTYDGHATTMSEDGEGEEEEEEEEEDTAAEILEDCQFMAYSHIMTEEEDICSQQELVEEKAEDELVQVGDSHPVDEECHPRGVSEEVMPGEEELVCRKKNEKDENENGRYHHEYSDEEIIVAIERRSQGVLAVAESHQSRTDRVRRIRAQLQQPWTGSGGHPSAAPTLPLTAASTCLGGGNNHDAMEMLPSSAGTLPSSAERIIVDLQSLMPETPPPPTTTASSPPNHWNTINNTVVTNHHQLYQIEEEKEETASSTTVPVSSFENCTVEEQQDSRKNNSNHQIVSSSRRTSSSNEEAVLWHLIWERRWEAVLHELVDRDRTKTLHSPMVSSSPLLGAPTTPTANSAKRAEKKKVQQVLGDLNTKPGSISALQRLQQKLQQQPTPNYQHDEDRLYHTIAVSAARPAEEDWVADFAASSEAATNNIHLLRSLEEASSVVASTDDGTETESNGEDRQQSGDNDHDDISHDKINRKGNGNSKAKYNKHVLVSSHALEVIPAPSIRSNHKTTTNPNEKRTKTAVLHIKIRLSELIHPIFKRQQRRAQLQKLMCTNGNTIKTETMPPVSKNLPRRADGILKTKVLPPASNKNRQRREQLRRLNCTSNKTKTESTHPSSQKHERREQLQKLNCTPKTHYSKIDQTMSEEQTKHAKKVGSNLCVELFVAHHDSRSSTSYTAHPLRHRHDGEWEGACLDLGLSHQELEDGLDSSSHVEIGLRVSHMDGTGVLPRSKLIGTCPLSLETLLWQHRGHSPPHEQPPPQDRDDDQHTHWDPFHVNPSIRTRDRKQEEMDTSSIADATTGTAVTSTKEMYPILNGYRVTGKLEVLSICIT